MEMRGSRGGGCCIARYTQHVPNNNNNATATITHPYYTTTPDMSKMDRIMLRFRPIAPKPATGAANSSGSGSSNDDVKNNVVGKRKRKASTTTTSKVRSNNGNNSSKRRKSSRSPDDQKSKRSSSNGEESCNVVTLPLLPETPDLSPRKSNNSCYYGNNNINDENTQNSKVMGCNRSVPTWLCFGPSDEDRTAPEVVPTSVTVEGVSDGWLDGNGLGRTDEERRRRLDEDTCPGFISDGWNRVWWTNEAYKRMVTATEEEDTCMGKGKGKVVGVRLGMREKVVLPPVKLYPAFTCRVRVQYGSHTMTVPCDAWRMSGGGFAWRLDVNAALSLRL